MKLTDLSQKCELEQIALLHDATKGWDKYLVMELLNIYYEQIGGILYSKYNTYEQVKEEGTIYLNEFYFCEFEHMNNNLYIRKFSIFFDVPSEDIDSTFELYEPIEILNNTLIDSLSDEDLQKLYPNNQKHLKTSKTAVYDYCKVGILFAQGLIKKVGFNYFYKEQIFESSNDLARHLKENNIVDIKSVRQLIDATITSTKNSLYNPKKAKNIIEYCKRMGVTPVQEFHNEIEMFKSLQGH